MARSLFWLSDEAWKSLEPHLPHGKPGKPRVDDRTVISGILHVLKTGCRWRDVPPAYGPHRRPSTTATIVDPSPYLAAHFRENGGRRSSS
jgi:transposase